MRSSRKTPRGPTSEKKAIENLKREGLMSPTAIVDADTETLEAALRPSGYFRQKAVRVRLFCEHLITHYDGDIARMAERPLKELRHELLSLHGIAPETADDILLYACELPVFVVNLLLPTISRGTASSRQASATSTCAPTSRTGSSTTSPCSRNTTASSSGPQKTSAARSRSAKGVPCNPRSSAVNLSIFCSG